MRVDELAALLDGEVAGTGGDACVTGTASLTDAAQGHVTFFANPRYLPAVRETRATAVIVPRDFSEPIKATLIRVDNASAAFATVQEKFAPPPVRFAPGVHPTAVIAPGGRLGEGVSVQPFAVIESGAVIGDRTVIGSHVYVGHETVIGADCLIYPHVTLRERVVLGNRVILHPGVVLGSDGFGFEQVAGKHVKIPQTGIVQVDDDVEIGANTTVDRARFGRTWIQEGTKIDNLVQIAHNVVIGRHGVICAQTGISGSVSIGNYVTLGGQVGIAGHLEIGDFVVVGAQSGIPKNIPPKEVWFGSPATTLKEAHETLARVRRLPKLLDRVRRLEQKLDSAPPAEVGLEPQKKANPE